MVSCQVAGIAAPAAREVPLPLALVFQPVKVWPALVGVAAESLAPPLYANGWAAGAPVPPLAS